MKQITIIILFIVTVLVAALFLCKKDNTNIKVKVLNKNFEKLKEAINFGALLDPSLSTNQSCLIATNEEIKKARDDLLSALDAVNFAYNDLTTTTAVWNAISDAEKTVIETNRKNYIDAANKLLLNAPTPSAAINGIFIYKWDNKPSCKTICEINNTSSGGTPSPANTTYNLDASNNANCSCPAGYFTVMENGFVKCKKYNTDAYKGLNSDIKNLVTLNSTTLSTISSFRLTCGGATCPTSAPLAIERTPTPTPTPAPTTPPPIVISNIKNLSAKPSAGTTPVCTLSGTIIGFPYTVSGPEFAITLLNSTIISGITLNISTLSGTNVTFGEGYTAGFGQGNSTIDYNTTIGTIFSAGKFTINLKKQVTSNCFYLYFQPGLGITMRINSITLS